MTARPPWRRRHPATDSGTRTGRAGGSTAARADVEVTERSDLVGEEAERRQEDRAASDLVGLRRACGQERPQASECDWTKRLNVGISDRSSGDRGADVRFGYHCASSVRVVEEQVVDTGEQQHGQSLRGWRVEQEADRSGSSEIPADSAAYSGARGSDVVADAGTAAPFRVQARIDNRVGHGAREYP